MFEPRHLKAYLALVKCMHFGRAAEMLGISQPTLSQQIRMLEEAVGAPLINRSNRTMELTPVGRVFAEDAQQILTLMERAKRNAEDILSGEEAEVKLGVCPGTISSGFLINLSCRVPTQMAAHQSAHGGISAHEFGCPALQRTD